MRRRLAIIRLRQRLRAFCDRVGLGPSFGERLCCALIVAVVPFVVSFILAFSFREPAGYAALQGVGAFVIVAVAGVLLIGKADDEALEAQRVKLTFELPQAAAEWRARKAQQSPATEEIPEEEEIIEAVPVKAKKAGVQRDTKRCPYCAEEIQADARKCRHCGEMLDGSRRARRPDRPTVIHIHHSGKSGGVAAVLEVLFGLFFQTFGVGHIYAGSVGTGLFLLFGYWFFVFVNVVLAFITCGVWLYAALVIIPAVWFILMILSPILASSAASDY